MDINSLIRPNILTLKAYEARELPCKVKLDANESPYGFKVNPKAITRITTNRYPDPEAKALKAIVAKELRVKPSNILVGNGSDELIYYLITTFGGPVLYPTPTFSMFGIISKALGENTVEIPLDATYDLDTEKLLPVIDKIRPKLIFLSSPNNPTGNCFSVGRILRIIAANGGLVVVDEAYQPFSGQKSLIPLIRSRKNLLVLRTLSKVGLAGLRLGFLIGDEALIREVNKVRLPFNVNSFSQAVATSVLSSGRQMRFYISSIVSERERLYSALKAVRTVAPYPSEANFILFRVPEPDRVYASLLKKGVLIKNMKGVVNGCLRVTVGTQRENDVFLKALKEVVS